MTLVAARKQRKRGLYHSQNVNRDMSRLKPFLQRFRGVATRYLDRDLRWHRFYARVQRLAVRAAAAVRLGNTTALVRTDCGPHCGAVLPA